MNSLPPFIGPLLFFVRYPCELRTGPGAVSTDGAAEHRRAHGISHRAFARRRRRRAGRGLLLHRRDERQRGEARGADEHVRGRRPSGHLLLRRLLLRRELIFRCSCEERLRLVRIGYDLILH